jgi:hypothetical protein
MLADSLILDSERQQDTIMKIWQLLTIDDNLVVSLQQLVKQTANPIS